MRRSITSNYDDTGGMLTFQEVARLTLKELKRQRKDTDVLLSHCLSDYDEGAGQWVVRDIASVSVSMVNDAGQVTLVDSLTADTTEDEHGIYIGLSR